MEKKVRENEESENIEKAGETSGYKKNTAIAITNSSQLPTLLLYKNMSNKSQCELLTIDRFKKKEIIAFHLMYTNDSIRLQCAVLIHTDDLR